MPTLTTEPIRDHWTEGDLGAETTQCTATVAEAAARLGHIEIDQIDPELARLLRAAGAEAAQQTGIRWTDTGDDPPIAVLRLIALVAGRKPTAGGPHMTRLVRRLE